MVRRNSSCEELLPPAHIRRGISPTAILHNFGSVLRQHPDTLPEHERASLFALSEPTTEFEAFISHSWCSPGFHKYLALLFEEATHWALLAAILAGGLVFCWQKTNYWPWLQPFNYRITSEFEPFFEVEKFSSPWEYLASACAAVVVLIFFPGRFNCKRKRFFLDCACIHQTDMRLKKAGIRHLAGFVAMARSMVIMWDGFYFSRLWCLYELGVFCKIHADTANAIRIVPLRMSVAVLLVQAVTLLGSGLYVVLFPLVAPYGIGTFYLLSGVCTLVVFFGCAVAGHDLALCRMELVHQLDSFDANQAECAFADDRAEILASLVEMYGGIDEFNVFVRTDLKCAVLSKLQLHRLMLPYRTAVVGLVLPLTGFWLFAMSWYRREDAHTQCCFAVYMTTFWLAGIPLVASWCMTGGSKLTTPEPNHDGPSGNDGQSAHPQSYSEAGMRTKTKTAAGDNSNSSSGRSSCDGRSGGSNRNLLQRVRAHWWQYLHIGLTGTFWFIGVWTTVAYFGVLAIANCKDGTILGLRRTDSSWVALIANLPVVLATLHEFRSQSAGSSVTQAPHALHKRRARRSSKPKQERSSIGGGRYRSSCATFSPSVGSKAEAK